MSALPPTRTFARLGIAALIYAATLWASLLLIPAAASASLVWPVSAAGIALIYLWGFEMWPALLLPLFLILLLRGLPAPYALCVAAANLAESALGAYLLSWMEFNPLISRLRDALVLILVAIVVSAISATITTFAAALFVGNAGDSFWLSLFVGHSVSLLSLAPFTLYWSNRLYFRKNMRELIEGAVIFCAIAAVDITVGWAHVATFGPFALVYILVVLLIWASLRTGPRGIGFGLAITALAISSGIIFAHTGADDSTQALLQTQILIGVLSIIFLPFTSIVEERKNAVIALENHVDKLQDAVEKIRSEDEAKSDFIAILAHELRNPLSPILSSLELMKQNGPTPENAPYVTSIASHVHVMARLLDDLLDISRVSQKKFKLERTPVELSTVINHAVEMARPFISSRQHTLEISLPEEPLWLHADPVRLEQIFVNILNNAAKYTDPGGKIMLTATRENNSAVIHIIDNGIGIEASRLPRVFDQFGGSEGATHSRGGLHIGLSLAKRMTELHRGSIEVRSKGLGQGSEFIVKLPLPAAAPLPLAEEPPQRARFSREELQKHAQGKEPLKVLVVDDNEAAARSLGALLERNGHPIEMVFTGTAALEAAQRTVPHAVLLDIGLPDLDGYEVGRRLRKEHGEKLIIIALTGYGQLQDREKAALAGFDRHLTKPASIVDVERTLAELRRA